MNITKEQLWYICNTYPESVSVDKAKEMFDKVANTISKDKRIRFIVYWESALKIIKKINDKEDN